MKRLVVLLCTVLLLLCGCSRSSFTLEYTIPAGDGSDFYFSDQQFSPRNRRATISAGAGIVQAQILLIDETGLEYGPFPLTQEAPVILRLDEDTWYRVGLSMPHQSTGPLAAELLLKHIDLRIE